MFPWRLKETRMRKMIFGLLGVVVLWGALFAFGGTQQAEAEVNVHINIGPPPPHVFHAPPEVVVIPGTYVYEVPDTDIFFYHGYWYRPYEGHWFRAYSFDGPWVYIGPSVVPRVLVTLPPHYRVAPGYRHIPYGELRPNWKRWERERHWDNDREWREGRHGGPGGREGEHRGHGRN